MDGKKEKELSSFASKSYFEQPGRLLAFFLTRSSNHGKELPNLLPYTPHLTTQNLAQSYVCQKLSSPSVIQEGAKTFPSFLSSRSLPDRPTNTPLIV